MSKLKALIIFFILTAELLSQTTAGEEFFLAFPYNNRKRSEQNDKTLKLYIIPQSEDSVKVTIENFIIEPKIVEFTIANDSVLTYTVPFTLEVKSMTDKEKKGIHVIADNKICLYAMTTKNVSTDMFEVYPITELDTSYVVSSYRNEIYYDYDNDTIETFEPSSVTIIGIKDSTRVRFIPRSPIFSPKIKEGEDYQFIINKGEVRQIIADTFMLGKYGTVNKKYNDLTGSVINSTDKIAVIGGHLVCTITEDKWYDLYNFTHYKTADAIAAMLPSTKVLGNHYLISPFYSSASGLTTHLRVVPVFDSTIIQLRDTTFILNKFEFYSEFYDSAFVLNSNKPILVSRYEVSTLEKSGHLNSYGDPFMVITPPKEQFLNNYKFYSPPMSNFPVNMINVMIHKNGVNSLLLDNDKIPDTLFKPIANTEYLWGNITINSGFHTIKSDSNFSITVYGLGRLDSYGYVPEIGTKRLLESIVDNHQPEIKALGNCKKKILITELNNFDSGIDSIKILKRDNIKFKLPELDKGVLSVDLEAELADIYQDGELIIEVKDLKGFVTIDTIKFEGLTIDIQQSNNADRGYVGKVSVDSVEIINYGEHDKKVKAFLMNNTKISLPKSLLPLTIGSRESKYLPIIYSSTSTGDLTDTLFIYDDCGYSKQIVLNYLIEPNEYTGIADCDISLKLTANKSIKIFTYDSRIILEGVEGQVEIYNVLGDLIYKENVTTKKSIYTEILTQGIYFIRLNNDVFKVYVNN